MSDRNNAVFLSWCRKAADRLMPRQALRREFRRQVAAMCADGHGLDPETARLWANMGYRP